LHDHALQRNYEIIGPHTPAHSPTNYNHRPDVLDRGVIRTSAILTYIESIEELTCDHKPILVLDPEPHETTIPRMAPFAASRVYYSKFLKHAIPGNPVITSAEEIDAAITTFT
jgi:hypothetical protein